ncbi:hypothetical protein quinque_008533 [Culex quinquefasciatus]
MANSNAEKPERSGVILVHGIEPLVFTDQEKAITPVTSQNRFGGECRRRVNFAHLSTWNRFSNHSFRRASVGRKTGGCSLQPRPEARVS